MLSPPTHNKEQVPMADEDNQHHDKGRGRRGESISNNSLTLGPRDHLQGTLKFEGDLTIAGAVEGELHISGDVSIESSAKVNASVEGNNVSVVGNVTGSVHARGRLSLSGSGTLNGDVRVAKLSVEDGATLNGNVSMGQPVGGGKGPSAHAEPGQGDAEQAVEEPQPEAVG
ncbi:MAG: hypothetical protein NVS9B1_21870 [Candidatus Dormibacteraceae bacterium]